MHWNIKHHDFPFATLIKPTVYISLSMRYILLFMMLHINYLLIIFLITSIRKTFFLNARKFNKQQQQKTPSTNTFFRKFLGFALVNCNPWTNGFRALWCNCCVVQHCLPSAWGSRVISLSSSFPLLRATTQLLPAFLIVQPLSAAPRICSRLIPSDNCSSKTVPMGTLKSFPSLLSKS